MPNGEMVTLNTKSLLILSTAKYVKPVPGIQQISVRNTVKTRVKEPRILEFRLNRFLCFGVFFPITG